MQPTGTVRNLCGSGSAALGYSFKHDDGVERDYESATSGGESFDVTCNPSGTLDISYHNPDGEGCNTITQRGVTGVIISCFFDDQSII